MHIPNLCVVIFPVYKSLDVTDIEVIRQAVLMTEGFDHIFIAPESLSFDSSFDEFSSFDIIRFDDEFFKGTDSYNKLMLSILFYDKFIRYKYMLIHQTDAYLFKPELGYWCSQNYDYIGAPWLRPDLNRLERREMFRIKHFPFIYSQEDKKRMESYKVHNEVGNGGLSLRKIETFRKALQRVPNSLLDKYTSEQSHLYNEDVFWSFEAKRYNFFFRKPSLKKALRFSVEQYPAEAYRINKRQLPFGCHAFDVHGTDFWKQFIPFLNKES